MAVHHLQWFFLSQLLSLLRWRYSGFCTLIILGDEALLTSRSLAAVWRELIHTWPISGKIFQGSGEKIAVFDINFWPLLPLFSTSLTSLHNVSFLSSSHCWDGDILDVETVILLLYPCQTWWWGTMYIEDFGSRMAWAQSVIHDQVGGMLSQCTDEKNAGSDLNFGALLP